MYTHSEGHGHLESQHKSPEFSGKPFFLEGKSAWHVVDLLLHLEDKH